MNDWIKNKIIAEKKLPIPNNATYHKSGIYIYERTDENGITWFYCGQAVDIYNRALSHAMVYDRLGLSLRKRGYYSQDNPTGWKFSIVETCPESRLDELERYYILLNMLDGKQSYNLTSGKQGRGKETFDTRKLPKGYYDGLKQGYENARREVKHLFDLHLNAVIKANKPNRMQEKALQKFENFLEGERV